MQKKKNTFRASAKNAKMDLSNRTIFLFGSIEEQSVQNSIEKIFRLSSESKEAILLIINSPGGCLNSMFALHDALILIPCPINVIILGKACSAAAILATANRPRRYITLSSTMLIHDLTSAYRGSLGELRAKMQRGAMLQDRIEKSILGNSNLNRRQMRRLMSEEKTIDAEHAVKYGLVDSVVEKIEEIQ